MPYVQIRLGVNASDREQSDLQSKITDAVSIALSKPKAYIMAEIENNCSLYMAGQKLNKGAYISIKLLGNAAKPACQGLTKNICDILNHDFGIEGSKVYVTYHPVDLWGWNGSMF